MTELPTTFGKYFLTEKLATGGMAEIYLAKLVGPGGFEKQLVIKQIHPTLTGQRHFVDLFVAEAKTLVTLAHGNIVPVYELGVVDDTYFIAMEYIDGPTLYRLTEALARRDARMEPAVAAWIAAKILEGLDYAHRKGEGVIHRDLSPRNVMLSRDGEVKLVDFGIAVTLGAVDLGSDAQSAPTGSFPYMSPEQVRREPLSGQTDVFSVGVLLWEMLVGRRLFARSDPEATLAAVSDGDVAHPSTLQASVPAKLDELVMRALERDQTARWSSAADMLGALQRYLYALDTTPGPRELAALVARNCPPETRRMPTHSDPPTDDAPVPGGPRTKVLEGPRGTQRARTETFATHVDLEQLLERATPQLAIPALADRDVGRALPGRAPPSLGLIIAAAVGTIVLGLAAVFVFVRGRGAVFAPDSQVRNDAPWYAFEADAAAPAIDATIVDAADPPIDAPRARPDAGAHPDAASVGVTGTATLVIGANPWAEIVVDGAGRGRTPKQLEVPAGKHAVELIYRGEDPPVTKTFPISVAVGETLPIQWDFTK